MKSLDKFPKSCKGFDNDAYHHDVRTNVAVDSPYSGEVGLERIEQRGVGGRVVERLAGDVDQRPGATDWAMRQHLMPSGDNLPQLRGIHVTAGAADQAADDGVA